MPEFTADTAGMGTLRLLEAIRTADWPIRFYQAGSSEMFGQVREIAAERRRRPSIRAARTRSRRFRALDDDQVPRGIRDVRQNGILFNHESPRRGETFVTRKVTRGDRRDPRRTRSSSILGNLDAKRDWGYARSTSRRCGGCSSRTSRTITSRDRRDAHGPRAPEDASALVGLDWERLREIDERYFRPTEVDGWCGDASKAREQLGWEARTTFHELVRLMLESRPSRGRRRRRALDRAGGMAGPPQPVRARRSVVSVSLQRSTRRAT